MICRKQYYNELTCAQAGINYIHLTFDVLSFFFQADNVTKHEVIAKIDEGAIRQSVRNMREATDVMWAGNSTCLRAQRYKLGGPSRSNLKFNFLDAAFTFPQVTWILSGDQRGLHADTEGQEGPLRLRLLGRPSGGSSADIPGHILPHAHGGGVPDDYNLHEPDWVTKQARTFHLHVDNINHFTLS